jgi:23S rRNA (adenine2503-C2)-methyltransferase
LNELPAFLSLDVEQTERLMDEIGASRVHARSLRRALLAGKAPEQTPRVSPRILQAVGERFVWLSSRSVEQHRAADLSCKHLIRLDDGQLVESVHLPGVALAPSLPDAPSPALREAAASACLSTQVGCAMACRFCASGLAKVARNLAAHELLEQIVHLRRQGPVQRVVFMGSGEPTQNAGALATALDVMRDEADLGPRYVVVSTVGPASAVDRLTAMGRKFTLALSLHSADAAKRASLIPTQKKVEPRDLLDAADRFAAATGRAYQVEYVLLAGINDSVDDARELGALMRGRRAHVSVIRWNAVAGMDFGTPDVAATYAFLRTLHDADVSARLRRTVGGESTAACGQLRGARGVVA